MVSLDTSYPFYAFDFYLFNFLYHQQWKCARTELSRFLGNVVQLLISLPEPCSLACWPISMHASTGIKDLTVLWIMVNICSQCCSILLEPESISRYFSCWQQKGQCKEIDQALEPREFCKWMILMHSEILSSFFQSLTNYK